MDKRQLHHWEEPQKIHTKIKHHILTKILTNSISIANQKCIPFYEKNGLAKVYTYLDLFAGKGEFDDGSKGSPILALDIMANHINTQSSNFNKLQIGATEKEEENLDHLKSLVKEIIQNNLFANQVNFYFGGGNWENFATEIKNLLEESGWGFVFADPWSTELKIQELKRTLNKCASLKDILVFFNFNTIARQSGRMHENDIIRICDTLGIDETEFNNDSLSINEKFEVAIKKHFSSLKKDFVVGCGFPTTVEGNLINADYFYLIFATNTPILVDAFLSAYEDMLTIHTDYKGNQQLPLFGNPDETYIYKYIEDNYKNGCDLFELYKSITQKFLSWKELTKTIKKVPTIKNVIDILNKFQNENSIEFKADEKLIYKKNSQNGLKGNIKYSEAKNSAINMKQINIQLCVR